MRWLADNLSHVGRRSTKQALPPPPKSSVSEFEALASEYEARLSVLTNWKTYYPYNALPADEFFPEPDWAEAAYTERPAQLTDSLKALRQRIVKESDFEPATIAAAIQTMLPMRTQGSVTLPGEYPRLAQCGLKLALLWLEPSPSGDATILRPTTGKATHQSFGGNSMMSNNFHEPVCGAAGGDGRQKKNTTSPLPDPEFVAARAEMDKALRECLGPFVIAAFKNHPIFASPGAKTPQNCAVAWVVNQCLAAFPHQGSQTDHLDGASLHLIVLTALTDGPATVFFKNCEEWLTQICDGGQLWDFTDTKPSPKVVKRIRYGLDSMIGTGPQEPAMIKAGTVRLAWAHVLHRAPHNVLDTVRGTLFTMWRLVSPTTSELASAPFKPKEQIFVHQIAQDAYGAAAARCVETNQQVDRIADASDHYPLTATRATPRLPVGGRNPCAYLAGLPPAARLNTRAGAWNDPVIQTGDPELLATCGRISDDAWRSNRIYALPTTDLAAGLFGCWGDQFAVTAPAGCEASAPGDADARGLIALAKGLAAHAGLRAANTDGRAHVVLATARAVQVAVAAPAHAQLEPLPHGRVVFGDRKAHV